jgi:hypothetical protein
MECQELKRLWDAYMSTLSAFHEAQKPFLHGIRPQDPSFAGLRAAKEHAASQLSIARKDYWEHAQHHGCRQVVTTRKDAQNTLDRLRDELREAHAIFHRALNTFDPLVQIVQDVGPTPDGFQARNQARRVYRNAHRQYVLALERYTDFVMRGDNSEDQGEAGDDEPPASAARGAVT